MLFKVGLGLATLLALASAQRQGPYPKRNEQVSGDSFHSDRASKLRERHNPSSIQTQESTPVKGNEDLISTSGSSIKNLVIANNDFMKKYYQVVSGRSSSNFVFSPFSIFTLLGMLRAGAKSTTLKEFQDVMNVRNLAGGNLNNAFSELFKNLKASSAKNGSTYTSSNRLFIQKDLDIMEDFQAAMKEKFRAPAEITDFAVPDATNFINKVVASDTNGKIKDLIAPGILNNMTRMVGLNVLYFNGAWENTFHGIATKPSKFYTHNGETIELDTMSTEDYFSVADIKNLNAKAIALPYVGKQMEMIILLPNEQNGLKLVEQKFFADPSATAGKIAESLNQPPKNIFLYLPKFSLQTEQDLQEPLRNLGIQQAFAQFRANFTGIANNEQDLYLSKVVQKAFLEVSEMGSEAGAASYGAVITPLSVGPAIEETIHVNHPFMGFIRHVESNLMLFAFRKME